MPESRSTPVTGATPGSHPQISLLLVTVFLAYLGQMTLNPIIAPLSREVGFEEWQIGVTISVAAVMVVVTSQLWGRRSQSWGRKPVLLVALALGVASTAGFALIAHLGMIGAITGTALFFLFVLLRGIGFGTALAAIPPTAQAYIAAVTDNEDARVKGMAGVGAAQGIAMIAGSALGGALAVAGLLTPLIAVPLVLLLALLLVSFQLRRDSRHELIDKPARVSPFDGRIWPFLVAGFGMFTALGFLQIISGFIVQDRLHLDAATTGTVTGAALLTAGVGMIVAQGVVVPRSGWLPVRLLRIGSTIAVVGFTLLTIDLGAVVLFIAILLVGFGLGIAMPGYTAGPTLLVGRDEQGGLAGVIAATSGLTFVIAPTASTALYGVWAPLPIIIAAFIMLVVTLFVFTHSRFRGEHGLLGLTPQDAQQHDAEQQDARQRTRPQDHE